MWIVQYALRYKYTVAVLAIAIALFGLLSARHMSSDILPRVESPEVLIVWTYAGLNAREMAAKVTSFSEIATLNNVDNLAEVRSETSNGVGLVKLRFQPSVSIERALAQVTAISQTITRRMPPGTTPPLIIPTSPSSVPILQLVISSDQLSDGALFDWARLALRAQVQSIPGIRLSLPYGGASRQIMVDIDPGALNAQGLSAADVSRAIASQNLTLPAGSLREGDRELPVVINASPETVEAFLDLPLRSVEGRVVRLRDVASVRDGEAVSTNIARLNGQNAVLVSVLKLGNASTLEIISEILARLPAIRAGAPPGLRIEPIFNQGVFVEAAITTIQKEILLVGALVALMVLLFLGSLRSTFIVLTSIPLALLASIIGLNLAGATCNLMSLGGLALAAALIFLVMVVNFQSWALPFAAISGLPVAVSGAFLALWITGTPLSVPALMGLIMVVGVSTANSVLVVSFARDLWQAGQSGVIAAVEAATTRLRPVCMTALTMILGVLPMALGFGEGGEQNAPLGRAVIGGLALGTFASLLLVPLVFAAMKRHPAPAVEEPADLTPELAPAP